jgi:hypothetical protein
MCTLPLSLCLRFCGAPGTLGGSTLFGFYGFALRRGHAVGADQLPLAEQDGDAIDGDGWGQFEQFLPPQPVPVKLAMDSALVSLRIRDMPRLL